MARVAALKRPVASNPRQCCNSLSMEEVQRNEHILENYFVPTGLDYPGLIFFTNISSLRDSPVRDNILVEKEKNIFHKSRRDDMSQTGAMLKPGIEREGLVPSKPDLNIEYRLTIFDFGSSRKIK
jgi:hypothetical protein